MLGEHTDLIDLVAKPVEGNPSMTCVENSPEHWLLLTVK